MLQIINGLLIIREALTLAKIRLPQDDPIILDLHSDWALQLEKEPSYEQAAMWFVLFYIKFTQPTNYLF